MALLHSTRLYIPIPWLYFTLLNSTLLCHGSTSYYFPLHYSTIALHYFSLHKSTMVLLHSIRLYITLPRLYFSLQDCTLLYHGSTSIYYTLHYSTLDLLHSTRLYITIPWLYFTLLDSTLVYHGSSSLY